MKIHIYSLFRFFLVGLLYITMVIPATVSANTNIDKEAIEENGVEAFATIENIATGEKKYYNLITRDVYQNNNARDTTATASYEVFIPIESLGNPNSSNLKSTTSGEENTHGVTAKLSVVFQVNASNEMVKAIKVYGSWNPNSSLYYLSNRYVMLHSGSTSDGRRLEKYPSKNSFSYKTGWGYNYRIWGDARPRAISEARIHISGMSGSTYLITVNVPYS